MIKHYIPKNVLSRTPIPKVFLLFLKILSAQRKNMNNVFLSIVRIKYFFFFIDQLNYKDLNYKITK